MGQKSSKTQNRLASSAQLKHQQEKNQVLKNANRQLSCMSREQRTKRVANDKELNMDDKAKAHALAEHLRKIAPFNGRWVVNKTLSEGTYGVVFDVLDSRTNVQGVIKVAKSMANSTTEWESFLLEKIFREKPDASIVRILDRGMLADQDGNGMEFVCLEKAMIPVGDFIREPADPFDRQLRAMDVGVQMLKGISDLHEVGLLHRDLKPDNMGVYGKDQPVVVLFDLGMARMYTDGVGEVRPPRTIVSFRGTPEWASGHAAKGREQTRWDDLVAWLYVVVELMDPDVDTNQPLPWAYRDQPKAAAYFKANFASARLLLRYCPPAFYTINSYLMTGNRLRPPDYLFIADRMKEGREQLQQAKAKAPAQPAARTVTPSTATENKNESARAAKSGET